MTVVVWVLALGIPAAVIVLALALCAAAARGDDLLRDSLEHEDDTIVIDFPAHSTRGDVRNGLRGAS